MIPITLNIILALAFAAYEKPQSDIIFSHQTHFVERDIECSACHKTEQSMSAQDENIPGHDECSACHSVSNAPDDCRLCHGDPDSPMGIVMPKRELIFPHATHLGENASSQECLTCHKGDEAMESRVIGAAYPSMEQCFQCHDGLGASAECTLCHSRPAEMSLLVHPPDWEHAHRFASNDGGGQNCMPCHHTESFCSDCHAGDNLVETVHDLNYRFNHGLDAKGKEFECQTCHDFDTFCIDCHSQEDAIPFNHFYSEWSPRRNSRTHADAARQDMESCASCHAEERSTCSQPGCHSDMDGVRGTDPSIHPSNFTDLEKGPWHDDPSFECFQCHPNPGLAGRAFCGYCHGEIGD
jgi:hypothetical protein